MPLHLRPLRDDELPTYIEHSRTTYERDLVDHAGLTPSAAAKKTDSDFPRLFPDGRAPEGSDVYVTEDGD